MSFWIIDLVGVFLTSITDSLMYGAKDGALTTALMGIAMVAIPLVVFGNVLVKFNLHSKTQLRLALATWDFSAWV